MHTALVDPQGWTLYEFEELVTDEQALRFTQLAWFGPYTLRLVHQPEINPPQTYIEQRNKNTGERRVAVFIKTREDFE